MSKKENLNLKIIKATELGNKINHLEKVEINVDRLKRDHKKFKRNNKLY